MKTVEKNSVKPLLDAAIEGIRDKKGHRISVLDMSAIDDAICKYMIIAEGNTPTQVEALQESVRDKVRELTGEKPVHTHTGDGRWIALDYVDLIVHLFVPDLRQFYAIEQLWEDADQQVLPDED